MTIKGLKRNLRITILSALSMFLLASFALGQKPEIMSPDVSASVVISEVYGGAGCGTAGCSTYQNDFIELYNRGATAVNLTGYSVQYASATGTAWQVTNLTGTIQPGTFYLIAESFGANGVNPLPTPSVTGTIAMSATAAKVALVNSTTALSGACPTGVTTIVDFVSYGATANCAESSTGTTSGNSTLLAATGNGSPAPSTTTSIQRSALGADTDNNNTDFTAAAPAPVNNAVPTAAAISISGRVNLEQGLMPTKALVTLTDAAGNARSLLTGKFGTFKFRNLVAGETYILRVTAKGHLFAPQVITANEDVTELNIEPME